MESNRPAFPSYPALKSSFAVDSESRRASVDSFATWATSDSASSESNEPEKRKRIRLSWLRERFSGSGPDRPPSSVLMDIRSLLSSRSLSSSFLSRSSSSASLHTSPTTPPAQDLFSDKAFARYNELIIKFCCAKRWDCLHRRASQLCSGESLEKVLGKDLPKGRYILDERDIWNSTLLHLLAQWGKDVSVVHLICQILPYAEYSVINARNINGDTFLHVLGLRWYALVADTETEDLANSLINVASVLRFQFNVRNSRGQNAFATFIPEKIEAAVLGVCPSGNPWRAARTLRGMLGVQDGGLFLSQSLATITHETKASIRSMLWRLRDSNEVAFGPETWVHDVLRDFDHWQNRACLIPYGPVPSLHTYLQHQTTISVDLLDQGADPNEYNQSGKTCLMVLLEKSTLLHLSESATIRLTRMLLDRGANLSLLDRDGNSALHYAVSASFPDVVQLLLEARADPDAKNLAGKSAGDIAIKHCEVARPGRGNETLYAAAQKMLIRLFDTSRKPRMPKPGSGYPPRGPHVRRGHHARRGHHVRRGHLMRINE